MPSKEEKAKRKTKAAAPTTPTGGARPLRWIVPVAAVVLAAGALLWWWQGSAGNAPAAAPAAASASQSRQAAWMGNVSAQGADTTPKVDRLRELTEQVVLADHTLCTYRDNTRYPVNSRPMADNPDQVYPNQPVTETHTMRKEGGGTDEKVTIATSQTRVFMAAGEAVQFTLRAQDAEGHAMPIFVTRALAHGLTFKGTRDVAQVPLSFADGGVNGDAVAGDGTYSGTLAPAQSGLASFNGTIRTEVKYNVGDRAGVVFFDVIYSPEVPAVWNGPIRDGIENGALVYYLKADIRTAGRYIVTGRVDDAKGKPFALATFNDVLNPGPNDIKLTVFGKLLRDQEPALPLTLRDVDGYLLKENTDPDRALMARISGVAHVSKNYPLKGFSDAEWQGEERTRYLTEYERDVERARARLIEYAPEQAKLPSPVSDCSRQHAAKVGSR